MKQLPVARARFFRYPKAAGENKIHEQLFADAEWIELLGLHAHQRARRTYNKRWHLCESCSERIGKCVAVERIFFRSADVRERQHHDGLTLVRGVGTGGLAEALGEHG